MKWQLSFLIIQSVFFATQATTIPPIVPQELPLKLFPNQVLIMDDKNLRKKTSDSHIWIRKNALTTPNLMSDAQVTFQHPLPSSEIVAWLGHCDCQLKSISQSMYYVKKNGFGRGKSGAIHDISNESEKPFGKLVKYLESKHIHNDAIARVRMQREAQKSFDKGTFVKHQENYSIIKSEYNASAEMASEKEVNDIKDEIFHRTWFVYAQVNVVATFQTFLKIQNDPRVLMVNPSKN